MGIVLETRGHINRGLSNNPWTVVVAKAICDCVLRTLSQHSMQLGQNHHEVVERNSAQKHYAHVVELVVTQSSEGCAERRGGSNPLMGTTVLK